jgi:hypothetical protein
MFQLQVTTISQRDMICSVPEYGILCCLHFLCRISIMQSMLHVSVTSYHHQAEISVHGHDIFSATVWYLILFTFSAYNFKHLDGKTDQYFNILTNVLS